MKYSYFVFTLAILSTSCATMNDSLQLGASMGAATGAAATFTGSYAGGSSPSIGTVALGAGLGSAVGMITAYFTHKKLEEDRKDNQADQFEMHFGDLPPSPFVVPKMTPKKGHRQ
jgi:hypothetical protein